MLCRGTCISTYRKDRLEEWLLTTPFFFFHDCTCLVSPHHCTPSMSTTSCPPPYSFLTPPALTLPILHFFTESPSCAFILQRLLLDQQTMEPRGRCPEGAVVPASGVVQARSPRSERRGLCDWCRAAKPQTGWFSLTPYKRLAARK